MYRDILVATDGGERGQRAADHALGLGNALGADIHALAVRPRGITHRDQIRADPEAELDEALASIKQTGDEEGVAVTTERRHGNPCETIVGYAEERDVDLIVMGATASSRFDRVVHGSTTVCVTERATVPVLAIGSNARPIFEQREGAEYEFHCRSCESRLTVSAETRDALKKRGCVLCGAAVDSDAFTPLEGDT
jgi:nucleotide-binding universal stress UspA family protein